MQYAQVGGISPNTMQVQMGQPVSMGVPIGSMSPGIPQINQGIPMGSQMFPHNNMGGMGGGGYNMGGEMGHNNMGMGMGPMPSNAMMGYNNGGENYGYGDQGYQGPNGYQGYKMQ